MFLRLNYMASICWASVGLWLLLVYPVQPASCSRRYVVLTALPYFVAMATDLRRCGYKRLDVLRIYGFNLILLPVNLAGRVTLDRAGDRRPEERVQAHAEGQEPHRRRRSCSSPSRS